MPNTNNNILQHQEPIFSEFNQSFNDPRQDFERSASVLATSKDIIVKDRFFQTENEFHNKVGQKVGLREIAGSHNVRLDDFIVSITNVGEARTVTLPKASLAAFGKYYIIKDGSGSCAATSITIATNGTELIDGDTTLVLNVDWASVNLFCNGQNWYVT